VTSLWFLIPAHGRVEQSRVCLRLLADACDRLTDGGIRASTVVCADDENLETARDLGFGTIEQQNEPLGRKWNDLFEFACRTGVDYTVPFGTDNWIDPELILSAPLPKPGSATCFRRMAFVNEDATRVALLNTGDQAGFGVRVYNTADVRAARCRPADEDAGDRLLDRNILAGITRAVGPLRLVYHDLHPTQLVDWKTPENLNSYESYVRYQRKAEQAGPFETLDRTYPAWALAEMFAVYRNALVAA
jgi:hypothetical protein